MSFANSRWKSWALALKRTLQPWVHAVQLWLQADGLRMSAAMTFYGLLSLSPLVVLIVGLLGWWVESSVAQETVLAQVHAVMGERGASVVEGALASAAAPSEGGVASIIAFVLLLSGATGVFVELQNSLDKLWQWGRDDPPADRPAWWKLAALRLRGLGYILVVGFLLLVTMLLSTAIKLLTQLAGDFLAMEPPGFVLRAINEGVSFLVITVLFVGLMRLGTGHKPALKFLVLGALVAAVLFTLSKQALAWYLSTAAVVSAYGAAGSLVVVLMWIYVTSAILLLGASCAKAWALHAEKQVQPSDPVLAPAEGTTSSPPWPEI